MNLVTVQRKGWFRRPTSSWPAGYSPAVATVLPGAQVNESSPAVSGAGVVGGAGVEDDRLPDRGVVAASARLEADDRDARLERVVRVREFIDIEVCRHIDVGAHGVEDELGGESRGRISHGDAALVDVVLPAADGERLDERLWAVEVIHDQRHTGVHVIKAKYEICRRAQEWSGKPPAVARRKTRVT
eukprot:scaffold992_cov118-Isochrysis_galbana.AAC.4